MLDELFQLSRKNLRRVAIAVRYTPVHRPENPAEHPMKLVRLLVFVVAAIHISGAQETAQVAVPSSDATLHYIHDAWDTLTRSMTDCHSLVDIKVTANPILYLPAGMTAPD